MPRLPAALLLALFACAALCSPARAQVIAEPAPPAFPDPKKFARGFFASGELGALVFLGRASRYASAGPNFGVRLGYDVLRWLALQAHVSAVSADANLPPPTVGQSFQVYLYDGEVRLSVQIRRFALFAEGGAGAAQISTNVLDAVNVTRGSRFSLAVMAGGGFDYHTLNRHFSLGLAADYVWLQSWNNSHGLALNAYLRYTH